MSAEPTTLDEAWALVESALPDGWRMAELRYEPIETQVIGKGFVTFDLWVAEAVGAKRRQYGEGSAPVQALLSLARHLEETM